METHDTIHINVCGRDHKIELCLGDITKLPLKSKVDLLLVSAFPNNYTAVPGTLIGALEHNLGLSVDKLSRNKQEDLRKHFNCWLSKELPKKLSYKRILCYEQDTSKFNRYRFYQSHSTLVSDVFRSLFTTFKDKEWSLITPILATGNQHANKVDMIRAMIKASAAWLRAGMPLVSMKIVIFKSNLARPTAKDDLSAIAEFQRLKEEFSSYSTQADSERTVTIRNDMLLIYTKEKEESVYKMLEFLRQEYFNHQKKTANSNENDSVEYFKSKKYCVNEDSTKDKSDEDDKEDLDEDNADDFELYDMYEDMMMQAKKVVVFLSINYLDLPKAMQLFNLALCLSNKIGRNILTPVCVEKIENLPEYMTLNQWIDCRVKSTSTTVVEKLQFGAERLYEVLQTEKKLNAAIQFKSKKTSVSKDMTHEHNDYDIFLSYAHKNRDKADLLMNVFKSKLPDVKVFFDADEIKAGYSWQETLYLAIDKCRLFIALLSEKYLESTVCLEEFSIAMSQQYSTKDYSTFVLPIWISDSELNSKLLTEKVTDAKKFVFKCSRILCSKSISNMKQFYKEILKSYIKPILQKTLTPEFLLDQKLYNMEEAGRLARSKFFLANWKLCQDFDPGDIILKDDVKCVDKELNNDVVVIYTHGDQDIARFLKSKIVSNNSNVRVKLSLIGDKGDSDIKSMRALESTYMIIALLSPFLVTSDNCLLQLQISLSLHRRYNKKCGTRICSLLLNNLPPHPSYMHLLPSLFSINDERINHIVSDINRKLKEERNVARREQAMLLLLASWIGFQVFRDNKVCAEDLPVIYSIYDLVESNFEMPKNVAEDEDLPITEL